MVNCYLPRDSLPERVAKGQMLFVSVGCSPVQVPVEGGFLVALSAQQSRSLLMGEREIIPSPSTLLGTYLSKEDLERLTRN